MTVKKHPAKYAVLGVAALSLLATSVWAAPASATDRPQETITIADEAPSFPDELSLFSELAGEDRVPSDEELRSFAMTEEATHPNDALAIMKAGVAWQFIGENVRAFADFKLVAAAYPNADVVYQRLANVAPQGIWVYVHGSLVQFPDAEPMIVNDRTLVPVRAVSEALGSTVLWDQDTFTATFLLNGRTVSMTRDSRFAIVDSNPVALNVAPMVVPPGRFMVPLRFVSEALGQRVTWHNIVPGHDVIAVR